MKRLQYVFRPNLNEPQHRRAWALLQQMPSARRKEFLVQAILETEQTDRLEKSIRKVVREELQAVNITNAVPSLSLIHISTSKPLTPNNGKYSFYMPDYDVVVKAVFAKTTHTVTCNVTNGTATAVSYTHLLSELRHSS